MQDFAEQLLGFIEARETRLLSWGFYDVSLTPAEVRTLITNEAETQLQDQWAQLSASGVTLEDLLDEMARANLLYEVRQVPPTYRSRFAEGVRLIGRLRQIFQDNQWATAPNLVSDIKLHIRPRQYPRRDQTGTTCWSSIREHCQQPALQKPVFDALASDQSGHPLSFAAFQLRTFSRILSKYNVQDISGSVVSAGTGAGKTKAFYIPAFLGICTELTDKAFTKIVAIYPRNVLLADQFREALSEASKLRRVLDNAGLRPLTFGALLGNTPWQNAFEKMSPDGRRTNAEVNHGWQRIGTGFVVPFLRSPIQPDEDLVWRDSDRRAGRTCLYRVTGNLVQPDVPDGVLRLTREALMENPPDVLFLSIEMLNREMGNPGWARTFGLGQGARSPRFLLLDEIHSYEGIPGAQVAWILRRWRHATRSRKLHVVGLSATLKEAAAHVARVAAIRQEHVQEFRPSESEMVQESMEYNLAIKGDPAGGTSLLSTSIQCGMLLARLLTPRGQIPTPPQLPIKPEQFFGRKVFGFTDNLDVVNRWLSDMADAEQNGLASFRLNPLHRAPRPNPMPTPAEIAQRDLLGQVWEMPRRIGHNLAQPLLVTRCSSQDPGADANADLIIATSSLEVGFDDPLVGAVLQHKRPLSTASFIQRKGRAGRQRGTRPWTLVVLSDYGADRWMFQQAERLFEPELEELRLPFHNPYVLRIQATYFLIDWIGRRVGQGSPFDYLRRPGNPAAQFRAKAILEDFLTLGPEWRAFRTELVNVFTGALSGPGERLTEAQVDGLVWDLPRPLLRHVVPCLLRKLEAQWKIANPTPAQPNYLEDGGNTYPLPEFLPKATFANLDVAEASLTLIPRGGNQFHEFLDVTQALTESCPGRVSKRYSTRVGEFGYWHNYSVNLQAGASIASVQQLYLQSFELPGVGATRIFQPESVTLEHRPARTLDSSYGSWNWQTDFRPFGQGSPLPVFSIEPWSEAVSEIEAFLHRDQAGIDVVRYAESCEFEIRASQQQAATIGRLSLGRQSDDGTFQREAVGFQRRVDGIRVKLNPDHLQAIPALDPAMIGRFRADYYLHLMQSTDRFPDTVNSFLAEWLWQSSLAMLTRTAAAQKCSLQVAQATLRNVRGQASDEVIRNIFRVRDTTLQNQEGRLVDTLRDLWRDPQIVAVIEDLEQLLWAPQTVEFEQWVRQRYVATVAQAFRATSLAAESDTTDDDLAIDVAWNVDGSADIYLTETNSGGLGQIEKVVQRLSSEPQRFHHGMRYVLSNCPRDKVSDYLLSILGKVLGDIGTAPLPSAFRLARQARGFRELETAKNALCVSLDTDGFETARSNVVSIVTKLLRPGSSDQTDRFTLFFNRAWRRLEERLHIGIDSRVFAYYCVTRDPIEQRLLAYFMQVSGGMAPNPGQLHATVDQMLFPVCKDSCPECLHQPNRYNDFGHPSRGLALQWLHLLPTVLSVDQNIATWLELCREGLQQSGVVTLAVTQAALSSVTRVLAELLSEELEVGVLFHPVSIQRVEKSGTDWRITLQLKNLVYA